MIIQYTYRTETAAAVEGPYEAAEAAPPMLSKFNVLSAIKIL